MLNPQALKVRWALGAASAFALTAWALLAIIFVLQRDRTLLEGSQRLLQSQQRVVEGLDQVFSRAELRAAEVGKFVQSGSLSGEQVLQVFAAKLLHDGELVQFGLLLEPDNPVNRGSRFAIGVTFGAKGIHVEDFVATRFEYWTKPWYLKTKDSPSGWWSTPYFNDAAGGQDTLTFDYPLRDPQSGFYGMASVSVSLERVVEMTQALGWNSEGELSDFVLLDGNQRVLIAADPRLDRSHTLDTAITSQGSTPLRQWLLQGKQHDIHLERDASAGYTMVRLPLKRVDWRLAAAISDRQLLSSLYRHSLIAGVAVLLIAVLMGLWLARRTARFADPLRSLIDAAHRLALGDLDQPVTVPPAGSSLHGLGDALEQCRQSLSQQSGELRQQHGEAQRKAGQALLARQLQAHALPADRVFLGAQYQAQINAVLRPAAQVAGDFYGFVSPVPGRCVFYLGEVDGADGESVLLMTRVTALLPQVLRQTEHPHEAMLHLLEHLQQGPEQGWRLRLQLGLLDLDEGRLTLCNADMPAPIRLRDQLQEALDLPQAPALSRERAEPVDEWTTQLSPGDRLLLFSDGLLKAQFEDAAPFGQTRLQIAIEKQLDSPAELLIDSVLNEVKGYSTDQFSDDLAMMVVAFGFRD
ncbi:SpoIIE family protein phosphatase [Pseudomarimonas arenosa]|uniref:SpoIIE family protein phosphatase n=1 Tax=Pseudomarimonas arenosa TaxID=2774145 RepID=A0AAW3ZMQ3_9GAMM|nr:SpoIIE family protein phosphatase [Pseudomarimonas arenosa]MBD8527248.1 SpoIIE family protein phosphatase [Pseudomarimonas arenosa]